MEEKEEKERLGKKKSKKEESEESESSEEGSAKDSDEESEEKETESNLNQSSDNIIQTSEKKPFLENEKIQEHEQEMVKKEKILEAEDLSGYTNEEKLEKFLKIYKEKISLVNEFFTKKFIYKRYFFFIYL